MRLKTRLPETAGLAGVIGLLALLVLLLSAAAAAENVAVQLLAASGLILAWMLTLRRQAAQKTRELREANRELAARQTSLQQAHDELARQLADRKRTERALQIKDWTIASANNAIALADLQGQLTYVNPSFLRLWGYDREDDVLRQPAVRFWQTEEQAAQVVDTLYAHGGWIGELVAKRSDGSYFDVQVSASLVKDETGNPLCMMASFIDVTEHKRVEAALRQSERQYRTLVEHSHDIIFTVDLAGNFLFVNPAFQRVFGFSGQEMQGLNGFELVHPDDRAHVEAAFAELPQGRSVQNLEYRYRCKTGGYVYVATNAVPLFNADGAVSAALGISRDVSERKRAEHALRESEARVRRKLASILSPEEDLSVLELADILDIPAIQTMMDDFFSLTQIGIAIVDLHGRVLVATGWQDICTQFHRVHPETRQHCLESDLALSSGVEPGTFKIYKCKNNMWDMVTPLVVGKQQVGNLFLGQFLFDDELPDYDLFRAQARRYGFDEAAYLAALDRVPRWSHATVNTVMDFYTRFATLISTLSYGNLKLARTLAERDDLLRSLKQSETHFRSYFELGLIGMVTAGTDKRFITFNDYLCKMWGYSRQELARKTWTELTHPDDLEADAAEFRRVLAGEIDGYRIDKRFIRKDGSVMYASMAVNCIRRADGSVDRFVTMIQDITERKQAEAQIKASLKEKEVLLREIHHRVKNNLMVVSSLIQMQADETSDPDALTLFRDLYNRVLAMSIIHEDLYQSQNLAQIEFGPYLERLLINIRQGFSKTPAAVKVVADDILLDVQKAIPCGLIVAELVTNAFKYAFGPPPSSPEIRVEMRCDESTCTLTVSDNGAGLPPDFDLHTVNTLGMVLVRSWATHQLKGSIEVAKQPGTRFTITFTAKG
jgi:PAS domain S-box-containing protein